MDRKREIYQPLYREVRQSHRLLRDDPFPHKIIWDPDDEPDTIYLHPSRTGTQRPGVSYSLWTALNREGRNAEASADIVEAFTQIQKATSAYLLAFHRVRDKWFEHGKAYAAERSKGPPSTLLPNDAGLMLFNHVLRGDEITDSQPQYAVEDTVPGREIRGRELLQNIPDADADVAEVQSTARALQQAFASAEASLEKKIRHITEKYEGG
jgi:hypothetical protein